MYHPSMTGMIANLKITDDSNIQGMYITAARSLIGRPASMSILGNLGIKRGGGKDFPTIMC